MSDNLTPSLPKRFTATPLPDGSTVVERTTSDRRSGIGMNILISVTLYGMYIYQAIPYFRTYEGRLPPLSDPMVIIGIGAFLMAIGQTASLLWQVLGQEEWQISTDELRWRGRIFGFAWEKRYRDGTLLLRRIFWGHGSSVEYRLYIRASGRRSRSLYTTFKWAAMNQLTRYLAAQLGWPVEQGWKG